VKWDLPKDSLALDYKVIGKNIGLLTIRSFQRGEFSTAKFDKIFKELSSTNGLIIDMRDNGGGNSGYADYVISHFSSKPIPQGNWRSPMYIAAHASWNFAPEWYMESGETIAPAKNVTIYSKPVVLLVNAGTFSSAEDFCVTFRGARRGKMIGSKTAGSTGNPISIDLGFGVGCRICTRHEWDADGNEFVGKGIAPDVEVEESPDIFLKNKDNLIEAALKELK
jgi:C-terminal processing protease CtpA/Prc